MGPKGIGPNKLGAVKTMAKQTGKAKISEKLKRADKEIIKSEPKPTYTKELRRLPRQAVKAPKSAGIVNVGNSMPTANTDMSYIKPKSNASVDKKELRKVKKGLIKEQRQKFKEAKKEIKSYTDY